MSFLYCCHDNKVHYTCLLHTYVVICGKGHITCGCSGLGLTSARLRGSHLKRKIKWAGFSGRDFCSGQADLFSFLGCYTEFSVTLHYSSAPWSENGASCKRHHPCVVGQEWPEPLHNNELFDLDWNSFVCVIIFLSDAYSCTWLLWLQAWSALFVCMSDWEWEVNPFFIASVWALVIKPESVVQRRTGRVNIH